MSILIFILTVLTLHWIADFVLQDDYMATNKSTSWKALMLHTMTYTLVWAPIALYTLGLWKALIFMIVTFICHTIQDRVTSKWTSILYEAKEYRLFFNVIGADQLLHYTQLFLTFLLLSL